jgi:hypothetical protein
MPAGIGIEGAEALRKKPLSPPQTPKAWQ